VLLALLLVPRFGPMGAALTMSGTWVLNNVLRQLALQEAGIGFRFVDERYVRPYGVLATATGAMTVVLLITGDPVVLTATALAAVALVWSATRHALQIGDLFPALTRVPLLRAFVA
jgi:hypothetical protein